MSIHTLDETNTDIQIFVNLKNSCNEEYQYKLRYLADYRLLNMHFVRFDFGCGIGKDCMGKKDHTKFSIATYKGSASYM